MQYKYIYRHGHFVVVNSFGEFVCSADTIEEALRDIKELEAVV